jgi:predicted ATPase
MFLRGLSIQNIRSLEHVSIDFTAIDNSSIRQWTCLLGENGCGKSTILRAAALVLAGSEALHEVLGDPARWIRNGATSGRIEAILETQTGETRRIVLELSREMRPTDVLKRNEANLEALDAALRHAKRNYFVAGYGVSRRLPSRLSTFEKADAFGSQRVQSFATLFSGDAVLRSLDAWAMDLDYRKGKDGLAIVRAATKNLLPDVDFERVDREKRQLIFRTRDGEVPLSELSDGYQNVAAWCGDLLYRVTETFDNYKNPLQARGLLLLDEVDLHLHPIWQRQLVQTLRERLPNFQILATTHSPLTAQQAGAGELYILRREKDRPVLHHYEDAPNLLRVDQLLVSPLFGLETGASLKVETLRKKNKAGTILAPKEKAILQSVPRRKADAGAEAEKIDLLRTVKAALASVHAAPSEHKLGLVNVRPAAIAAIKRSLKKK